MSTSTQLSVLVIGNGRTPEFRPALDALPGDHFVEVPDIPAAFDIVAHSGQYPDLILVCQHWPDQYAPRDVQRLPGLAPLARLVCIHGPWCEADGRNRSIWPVAIRCPHSLAPFRLKQILGAHQAGRSPLPMTASRDETWLDQFAPRPETAEPPPPSLHRVHVLAADSGWREFICEALSAAGIHTTESATISQPADSNIAVVVFDADPWSEIHNRLDHLRHHYPQAALLAMTTLPDTDLPDIDTVHVLPKLIPTSVLIGIVKEAAAW